MRTEFQQIQEMQNITQFKNIINRNDIIRSLPNEIIDATLNKDISLDTVRELVKLNDKEVNQKIIKAIATKKRYEKNIVKIAKFSVKRSQMMKKKISKLNKQLDKGLILSSVWDIGKRDNYAGDSDFYGNAPTQIVEQSILRLTKNYDVILDPMAGSGTTIDVCKVLKRKCIAYDLNPKRKDIIKNDSRKLPLKNEVVDMVFIHPPYWKMVKYSNDKNDLSKQTLDNFLESMRSILLESKRVLKKNKYITILIGDMVFKGKFIPISRIIANMAEEIGLEDSGCAIKLTVNSVSQVKRGKAIYAELANTKNLKINHDYVMFWKK